MKSFIKHNCDPTPFQDGAFHVASLAREAVAKYGKDEALDATVGTLHDEAGNLVAFDSVFDSYNRLDNRTKAAYSSAIAGNPDYRRQVYEWVCGSANLRLHHQEIATPGGSGAISMAINNLLDRGDILVVPSIGWESYKTMAQVNGNETLAYEMFAGDSFNGESFYETCKTAMKKQGKVLAVINDPCHNPTGYSMALGEWQEVIDAANELSRDGPFILLDDIAYIDFAYDGKHAQDYMKLFDRLSENVMAIIAFSCSKTLTSYGMRCGCQLILGKDEGSVQDAYRVSERYARATWSNCNNAAMENFVAMTTVHKDAFLREKERYIHLLKGRSDRFLAEADACGLAHYPYKEGFFVTLKIEDPQQLDRYHRALLEHRIFAQKMNRGIRIALCSLPLERCMGLAYKMKEILEG